MESEDIKEIFRSLNESNQSILTLVAKGMSLAQKEVIKDEEIN